MPNPGSRLNPEMSHQAVKSSRLAETLLHKGGDLLAAAGVLMLAKRGVEMILGAEGMEKGE